MDRNVSLFGVFLNVPLSLSARRAWIEICLFRSSIQTVLSLSARRAWIEIETAPPLADGAQVALRKESVDRNVGLSALAPEENPSLSARRAWIEIPSPKIL